MRIKRIETVKRLFVSAVLLLLAANVSMGLRQKACTIPVAAHAPAVSPDLLWLQQFNNKSEEFVRSTLGEPSFVLTTKKPSEHEIRRLRSLGFGGQIPAKGTSVERVIVYQRGDSVVWVTFNLKGEKGLSVLTGHWADKLVATR
jgi:hypothetical protein